MKEKYKFIFPSCVARRMKKIDSPTLLIVNMFSIIGILIVITILVFYRTITLENGFLVESFVLFNLFAGYIFLSSAIITNYNQYNSYKEIQL